MAGSYSFADAVDLVLPYLAADPSSPVTEEKIRSAAIEFCATSGVWKYTQEGADLMAGERAIELEPDMGADVARVEAVRYQCVDVPPANTARWAAESAAHLQDTDGPAYWTQNDSAQILVLPTPTATRLASVDIDMVLQPSLTATAIPAWIWAQWGERIVDGALARLMLMPGKPWSAGDVASVHQQKFHNAMYSARVGTITNRGKSPLRTRSIH